MISRAVLLSNWSELMLTEKNIHEEPELALLIYTVKQYSDILENPKGNLSVGKEM